MKVGDGTGDVLHGRQATAAVTNGISREAKSRRKPCEKSDKAIVPVERKLNDGRDNKTRPEGRVSTSTKPSGEVSVGACLKRPTTPPGNLDKVQELKRGLCLRAKRRKLN